MIGAQFVDSSTNIKYRVQLNTLDYFSDFKLKLPANVKRSYESINTSVLVVTLPHQISVLRLDGETLSEVTECFRDGEKVGRKARAFS